ncbi:immunoglobulin-like domain-containing protein [Lentibacillus kimchii]|uniref:Immunoglobulin-like domain-containing protein n=2 Tax=Lentibacillus kimchii TaxID=1542911 RepID=A0ABW2UVV7_9BACI
MFVQALDLDTPDNVNKVLEQYDDVDATNDHAEAIAAVTEAGIFQGENGHFDEYGTISREQMATVLVEAYDLDKYDNGDDVDLNTDGIDASHVGNVQILANLGITNQTDGFDARGALYRDQFATFMYEMQKMIEGYAPGVDKEAPNISVDSDSTVNVDHDADFSIPKATAEDNRDGSVKVDTQITDSDGNKVDSIDTSEAGSYIVTYTAADEDGNKTATAITVNVSENEPDEDNEEEVDEVSFSNVSAEAVAPNKHALEYGNYMYEVTGTVSNVDKGEEIEFIFHSKKDEEDQDFTATVDADGDFDLSPALVEVEGAPDTVDVSYTDDNGETTEKNL